MKVEKIAKWLDKEHSYTNIRMIVEGISWSIYGIILSIIFNYFE